MFIELIWNFYWKTQTQVFSKYKISSLTWKEKKYCYLKNFFLDKFHPTNKKINKLLSDLR
jgi:hypothetical protein